jgi:molecular chaperone GrpE (heat shock protein)
MNSTDQLLQKTEADILEAFSKFGSQFSSYTDMIHRVDFTPENSDNVRAFFKGLDSMQDALHALVEATKIVAEVKGVDFL